MIKDLAHSIDVENTIIPQAFTNTDTETGATVDIVGFREVVFVIELGALTAAGISISLEGQDEDDNWEEIDSGDLISDSALSDIEDIAATDDEEIHKFGLATANYKAVRAKVDADTESGAGDLAVSVIKSSKYSEPV